MAVNPSFKMTVTLYDQSSEIASMSANRASADSLATFPAVLQDFIDDAAAIIDWDETDVKSVSSNATRRVTNDLLGVGNREDKWLFQFQDATTLAPYNVEVPCRTGGVDTVSGTDFLPEAVVAVFRDSAEALFRSPDGNAGNLLTVQLIGRRS